MVTTIRAWGNSQGLYIPKTILKQLGLSTNDSVNMSVEGNQIVIKKDDEFEKKLEAFRQLQEFRKNYAGRSNIDYKKELMEYLDERYLNV